MKNSFLALTLTIPLFLAGCAAPLLKGVDAEGAKAYLGSPEIQGTSTYQKYVTGPQSEAAKLIYVISRIGEAEGLLFQHEGAWHDPQEAYRGSMWMLRKNFEKGETARDFIRLHVWHSDNTGTPRLVKYPDGSLQIGYYILLNELDLLEATASRELGT
ncbi:MAG: DUF5329 family protein [Candidatus Omnitrophota bacterium]|nr:DUF5329 family protein [Candidatus Omnitrophota bacterium]